VTMFATLLRNKNPKNILHTTETILEFILFSP
jgi:hypothetical protein